MIVHGGLALWPSEMRTFFTSVKQAFLSFYGRLVYIRIFGREFWSGLRSNAIVVANHVTGVDSIILQIALRRRLFMLAARKWFEGRLLGFFMTFFCDMVPVALGEGPCNLAGIKRALSLLRKRQSIAIYPAGRMYRDGSVPDVNNGAAYLAYKSGVPIVPVYMANLALGPKTTSTPRQEDTLEGLGSVVHNIFNRNIQVHIAPPIYPHVECMDRKREINRLNAEIRRSFGKLERDGSLN